MQTFCLLAAAFAVGQNFDRTEWRLVPQFGQGSELVYKGHFTEESLIPGVQYQRRYALETIFFVDNDKPGKNEAAIMTSLTLINGKYTDKTPPGAVRLERVRYNQHGRVFGDDATQTLLTVPLNGPALLEAGAFVEFPTVPVNTQSYWEEFEEGRPLRGWRIQGAEQRSGAMCVKLIGSQQSQDWKQPRADSNAWRRRDVIWFSPQVGVVFRVERTIEHKDPAHSEPTSRLVAVYDLESRLRYSGGLFDDRKEEIAKVRKFQEDAEPLLRQPAPYRGQIEAMQRRIVKYLESTSSTPYRKALAHLQTRLERATLGEVQAGIGAEELPAEQGHVPIGKKVPDFVVTDLISERSLTFYKLLSTPILVLYYNPLTPTGKETLRFAQKLCDQYGDDLLVLGMAVSNDVPLVRQQHEDMRLTFPVLDGNGMHRTFGVDGTPRVVLLDGEGVVRFAFTGWGRHSPKEVSAEIEKCMRK